MSTEAAMVTADEARDSGQEAAVVVVDQNRGTSGFR